MSGKMENIKNICQWILEQGAEVTRAALEEQLDKVYRQGWIDGQEAQVQRTLEDLLHNAQLEVRSRMGSLCEANFYNVPSPEDQAQMRAYEFLMDYLPELIKDYNGSLPGEPLP